MKGFYNQKTGEFLTESQMESNNAKGRERSEFVIEVELTDVQSEVLITLERKERNSRRKSRYHRDRYGKVVSLDAMAEEDDENTNKTMWEPIDASADVFANIERDDEVAEVRQAVDCLNARHRELVRLYFEEQKTQVEIAAIFGIDQSCVARQLKTVLSKLEKLLKKDF
jgi:RNA polymerase sigma factor (sigma-70 family)